MTLKINDSLLLNYFHIIKYLLLDANTRYVDQVSVYKAHVDKTRRSSLQQLWSGYALLATVSTRNDATLFLYIVVNANTFQAQTWYMMARLASTSIFVFFKFIVLWIFIPAIVTLYFALPVVSLVHFFHPLAQGSRCIFSRDINRNNRDWEGKSANGEKKTKKERTRERERWRESEKAFLSGVPLIPNTWAGGSERGVVGLSTLIFPREYRVQAKGRVSACVATKYADNTTNFSNNRFP